MHMKKNTVITISRQYGSGGRQISRLVSEKMGVKRYDRTVVAMAAESLGAGDRLEDVLSRSYEVPKASLGAISTAQLDTVPAYNTLYKEQAHIIRSIAAEGNGAVFLGRCAEIVLAGQPEVYSFFTCADDAYRTRRAGTHYGGMSLKQLNEIEEKRSNYYAFYTGKKWGDPQNFDLVINTSRIPLEQAADLIIDYVNRAQGE